MMKIIALTVSACVVALVVAAPQAPQAPQRQSSEQPPVQVLKQDSFVGQDGYNFEFSNSDGTSRQETGELIHVGNNTGIAVNGSYSYVAPDGQHFSVTFTADDKGFKPEIHIAPPSDSQPAQQQ